MMLRLIFDVSSMFYKRLAAKPGFLAGKFGALGRRTKINKFQNPIIVTGADGIRLSSNSARLPNGAPSKRNTAPPRRLFGRWFAEHAKSITVSDGFIRIIDAMVMVMVTTMEDITGLWTV
jgi:hypothetical protein